MGSPLQLIETLSLKKQEPSSSPFDLSNIQTQQINFINFNNEKPYTPS